MLIVLRDQVVVRLFRRCMTSSITSMSGEVIARLAAARLRTAARWRLSWSLRKETR